MFLAPPPFFLVFEDSASRLMFLVNKIENNSIFLIICWISAAAMQNNLLTVQFHRRRLEP